MCAETAGLVVATAGRARDARRHLLQGVSLAFPLPWSPPRAREPDAELSVNSAPPPKSPPKQRKAAV